MRITGGTFRGRILSSPEGLTTRPTSDRARQALFNILNHAGWRDRDLIDAAHVMDVFAGTGALGLEALSQGAADAIFIEKDANAIRACQKNIDAMKLQDRAKIEKWDAVRFPSRPDNIPPRTLVFLDPPYGKDLGYRALSELRDRKWLAPGCACILEMAKAQPEKTPDGFAEMDERAYGVALLRFLIKT